MRRTRRGPVPRPRVSRSASHPDADRCPRPSRWARHLARLPAGKRAGPKRRPEEQRARPRQAREPVPGQGQGQGQGPHPAPQHPHRHHPSRTPRRRPRIPRLPLPALRAPSTARRPGPRRHRRPAKPSRRPRRRPPCTSGPGTYPMAGAPAPPPEKFTPRSIRSRRAMTDRSSPYAAGRSTRAQMSSSWSRGEVAPRISVSPSLTRSAARLSSAAPKTPAWACMRSTTSDGASMSPFSAASGTAARITRSRSRSSRSATNLRGSLPPR